jgi:hypothetical protein
MDITVIKDVMVVTGNMEITNSWASWTTYNLYSASTTESGFALSRKVPSKVRFCFSALRAEPDSLQSLKVRSLILCSCP